MRKRHSIDILFSLSLFTVFVICAFLVLLFQTGSYRSIIAQGEQTERQHTPLAYVRAKIRSADEDGGIRVTKLENTTAIELRNHKEKTVTYIYAYKGKLCELYMSEEVEPMLRAGTALFDVRDFEAVMQNSLLHVSLHDLQGKAGSIVVEVKSE